MLPRLIREILSLMIDIDCLLFNCVNYGKGSLDHAAELSEETFGEFIYLLVHYQT